MQNSFFFFIYLFYYFISLKLDVFLVNLHWLSFVLAILLVNKILLYIYHVVH